MYDKHLLMLYVSPIEKVKTRSVSMPNSHHVDDDDVSSNDDEPV